MEEKRKFERFEPAVPIDGYFELSRAVTGKFRNHEEFLIKNVSLGGFNLISNFLPIIGKPHQIFINYHEQNFDLIVNIMHSLVIRIQDREEGILKPGIVYATGCEIIFDDDAQKELVREIIKNECQHPAPETPAT